jgi:hypothetical protein
MSWWSRIIDNFRPPRSSAPEVRVVEGGLDLVFSAEQHVVSSIRWADVSRVQTYKRDLVTTDCILLQFEFTDGRPPVHVSEEWAGFADLFEPLSQAFPSISPDWYMEVMSPAFATNNRVLYDGTHVQR